MHKIHFDKQIVTGSILAGGMARRMAGQDKGLINLDHKPLIEYVLEAFRDQVGSIIVNANRNKSVYAQYNYPVISDQLDDFCGPLAGIASVMQCCQTELMAAVPCDSPFIPNDLVQRLYQSLIEENADIAVAHDGERIQPVFTLLKCNLFGSIMDYLNSGERKMDKWFFQHPYAIVDFSDHPDLFLNINTPEDLVLLELKLLAYNNENR